MATKPAKVLPTFKVEGNATEAGHDEHILVLSDIGAAIVLAGLNALLSYEGHQLDPAETKIIEEMTRAIRGGLADGIEARKQVTLQ